VPDKTVIADLATDVLEFLAEQIDSVPHLEALLLLYKQTAEQWTVERTAARLYVSADTADRILRDLERRKLVSKSLDDQTTVYAYDPSWDETGQLMERVAMTYRSHLTAVSAFIHSKASQSVLEFARAFKFKKD
jgi:Fic family protein